MTVTRCPECNERIGRKGSLFAFVQARRHVEEEHPEDNVSWEQINGVWCIRAGEDKTEFRVL